MKRTTLWKIAALATSLGIAGAYLAHRASARPATPTTPAPAAVAPTATPAPGTPAAPAETVVAPPVARDPTHFYGSKSAPMFEPPETPPDLKREPPTPPQVTK
jgi:hypothetical protein